MGTNSLWGVNSEGRVVVRLGISPDNPAGREWATVDGEPMKQVLFFWRSFVKGSMCCGICESMVGHFTMKIVHTFRSDHLYKLPSHNDSRLHKDDCAIKLSKLDFMKV